jgi:hypothetical protein
VTLTASPLLPAHPAVAATIIHDDSNIEVYIYVVVVLKSGALEWQHLLSIGIMSEVSSTAAQ